MKEDRVRGPPAIGFVFASLALFRITGSSLWEKRFGVAQHLVMSNLGGFSFGQASIIPLMDGFETMEIVRTWQLIGSMVYLIIASSLIAVGLQFVMIRTGGASKVSALFFIVPPIASAVASNMLDEIMLPLAWVGMIIAGLSVFMATTKKQAAA